MSEKRGRTAAKDESTTRDCRPRDAAEKMYSRPEKLLFGTSLSDPEQKHLRVTWCLRAFAATARFASHLQNGGKR